MLSRSVSNVSDTILISIYKGNDVIILKTFPSFLLAYYTLG